MTPRLLILIAIVAGFACQADEAAELDWDDLLPADTTAVVPPTISEDSLSVIRGDVQPEQSAAGSINASLNGRTVRIPGFMVPLESDEGGLLSEFFLVPYFGACIHVPPPPPNQIIYVTLDEPFDLQTLWTPYWIEGDMSTESKSSAMGTAGYTVKATLIEEYKW